MIPLFDLDQQHESIREELDAAVAEVVASSRFIGGPVVDVFADEFAAYCNVQHAIPCANGTEALRLALVAALGQGDGRSEIISVSHTFAATAEAIIAAGYKPVMVDVDPETYLMDFEQMKAARRSQTVAVVAVHLYGQMVDIERICAWAQRHRLVVVEDAAQAHGAHFEDVRPGQVSDAATFSFFPGKNLGAWGDAGAVISNNENIAQTVKELLDHGRIDKFTHARVGTNARMDAIQAAILSVKLRYLDRWNEARRRAARWYDELLSNDCECVIPRVATGARHVYHQYVVQVDKRSSIREKLKAEGIATGIHYPIPLHEQPAFKHLNIRPAALSTTHALCRRILSLPMFPGITQSQVERVAAMLKERKPSTVTVG